MIAISCKIEAENMKQKRIIFNVNYPITSAVLGLKNTAVRQFQ